MGEIRWLKEARNDLKDIYYYIARDSKRYTKLQIERILFKTEILKDQPSAGKSVEEIDNPSVRELIEGNYRIIYRIVDQKTVHILMVHHGARDLYRRLK